MSEPLLARWPVTLELPVQWGDMDSFGHVNNVMYLRWFESARIAYFTEAGVLSRMAEERIGPILARGTIDYRLALEFPDRVLVSATVVKLGNTSFTMEIRLRSQRHGAVAAEGENVVVLRDYKENKSIPLWPKLRSAIAALEARGTGVA